MIKGKVNKWGNIEDVTNEYVYSRENSISDGLFEIQKVENRQGNGMIQFHSLEFTNQLDERTSIINMGDELSIKLSIRVNDLKVRDNYRIGIQINDSEERPISLLINEDDGFKIKLSTTNYFKIIIKNIKLYPGRYYVSLLAACKHSTDVYDILSNIAYFDVENNGQYTNRPLTKNSGVIFLNAKWSKI